MYRVRYHCRIRIERDLSKNIGDEGQGNGQRDTMSIWGIGYSAVVCDKQLVDISLFDDFFLHPAVIVDYWVF